MTLSQWLAERAEDGKSVPDCGDNSCRFAKEKGGMRTNGGCRCLKNTDITGRRYFTILHNSHAQLVAVAQDLLETLEELGGWDQNGQRVIGCINRCEQIISEGGR